MDEIDEQIAEMMYKPSEEEKKEEKEIIYIMIKLISIILVLAMGIDFLVIVMYHFGGI